MLAFKEIWICPPTCNRLHSEQEVIGMLGILNCLIGQVKAMGLRPCLLKKSLFYSTYYYSCSDIQEFCYNLEASVGVDYHVYDRVLERTKDEAHAFRYRRAFWADCRSIGRTEKLEKSKNVENGFVYLIRWNNLYKIGMSRDVDRRLYDLLQLPDLDMDIVHKVKSVAMRQSEKALHDKFAHYRHSEKREWFKLPQEAVDWICALKDGDLDGKTLDGG